MPARKDLRLRVDWIRCDGYGLCGDLLPELIGLDEWRYPILPSTPVDRRLLHDAQRAVDCCPMKALILEPVPAPRALPHRAPADLARPRRRPAGEEVRTRAGSGAGRGGGSPA